ncbi:MAG TPA: pyridoxamine 5'-phosphate oxidase family protein [Candidatus Binataceae bacterium]|nr:pyridoxamine 5'-phosphate oxidase family protein [Candidatus Binataceae bacterium]
MDQSKTGDVRPASDVAFTPAVKAIQERRGSRAVYHKMETTRGWRTTVTPELAAFIAERDSVFLATSNALGQPYIQHRGGPKGFIRVLDEKTLAFADFAGNRQYITTGNLTENDRAFLFMMDYAHQRRFKIWGHARVVENDPDLINRLMPTGYDATPEQVMLFTIEAWDTNCHQHIPRMVNVALVADAIEHAERRIAELEAENAKLKQELAAKH